MADTAWDQECIAQQLAAHAATEPPAETLVDTAFALRQRLLEVARMLMDMLGEVAGDVAEVRVDIGPQGLSAELRAANLLAIAVRDRVTILQGHIGRL